MAEKNDEKYRAYKLAHDRMNAALEKGFPLEVITIAESVITDRLISHANFHGEGLNPHSAALGPALNRFKRYPGKVDPTRHKDLVARIDAWRDKRNQTIHGIAKSDQGEGPTIAAEDFVEKARAVAESGMELMTSLKSWHAAELKAANKQQ